MTDEANLNERLTVLARDGWQLRTCYTLRRPEGKDGSVRSYHADELQTVVKRVEQEVRASPKRSVESKPVEAELPEGWVKLAPVEPRPGEKVHSAEKLFEGDPKPVQQSAGSAMGLVKACTAYDLHRASSVGTGTVAVDTEMARRLRSSLVHTGLSSTENY